MIIVQSNDIRGAISRINFPKTNVVPGDIYSYVLLEYHSGEMSITYRGQNDMWFNVRIPAVGTDNSTYLISFSDFLRLKQLSKNRPLQFTQTKYAVQVGTKEGESNVLDTIELSLYPGNYANYITPIWDKEIAFEITEDYWKKLIALVDKCNQLSGDKLGLSFLIEAKNNLINVYSHQTKSISAFSLFSFECKTHLDTQICIKSYALRALKNYNSDVEVYVTPDNSKQIDTVTIRGSDLAIQTVRDSISANISYVYDAFNWRSPLTLQSKFIVSSQRLLESLSIQTPSSLSTNHDLRLEAVPNGIMLSKYGDIKRRECSFLPGIIEGQWKTLILNYHPLSNIVNTIVMYLRQLREKEGLVGISLYYLEKKKGKVWIAYVGIEGRERIKFAFNRCQVEDQSAS